jgi:RNA polymerase sigma-70 factor (ECF subfamily)
MCIDSSIAQKTKDVTKESLEDLYTRYYNSVYKICLRMTANVADAEDLTHNVFLQLPRKLASFRGDSAFSTWLHRVTVNQVLMHFRKKSVKLELPTENGKMPEGIETFTIQTQTLPIIDHIALAAAIEKLPPGYKKVFLLHDVEGYEHEEIAKLLGTSSGTSKSQLHKARLRLRTLLGKYNKCN